MGDICVGTIVSIMSFRISFIIFKFAHFTLLLVCLVFSIRISLIFLIRCIFFGQLDVTCFSPFLFIPFVKKDNIVGCVNTGGFVSKVGCVRLVTTLSLLFISLVTVFLGLAFTILLCNFFIALSLILREGVGNSIIAHNIIFIAPSCARGGVICSTWYDTGVIALSLARVDAFCPPF